MKVAVLGLGSAGRRHAENLLSLGHDVVGFDPAAEAPTDVAEATSAKVAIEAAEAVIVASPSSFHCEHTVAVLEAGRHVLVEKPLALRPAEARELAERAAESGLVCGVAMNLRFHRALVGLQELVTSGALGEIYLARASFGYDLRRWRPDQDYRQTYSASRELGGGIVLDAIHELDYLLWLLGPVDTVSAELAHVSGLEVDVEDIALAQFRFTSGALGAVDLNFFEPAYRRGCILVGDKAVAHWDWSTGLLQVGWGEEWEGKDGSCDVAQTYVAELVDFFEAIHEGKAPKTTALDGLAALELAEAMKQSSELGARVSVRVG